MPAIRIFRPKRDWSVAPATVLPAGLLMRLFGLHLDLTLVLDDKPVGKIGVEQVKLLEVEPGEHRLYIRLVLFRRSKQLRLSLKEDEERTFICGTNGMGWPTLREASLQDLDGIPGSANG
jgi:hypothetical protein